MGKAARNYLCVRRGRYSVRVRVPAELRARLGKEHVEKYLRTSSSVEARRLSHAAVAQIFESFERTRRQELAPEDVAFVADAEARRVYRELVDEQMHPDPARDIDIGVMRARLEQAFARGEPDERERQRAEELICELGLEATAANVSAVHKAIIRSSLGAVTALRQGRELPPAAAPRSMRLADASKQFLADRKADRTLSAKTLRSYEGTLGLLQAKFGDRALAAITRADAADFLRQLDGAAGATVNRHITGLMQLWKWAARTGVVPEDHRNPWSAQRRKVAGPKSTGWLPLTVDELNALVERPEARPKRHSLATARAWVVLVALYSGMREGEICALDAADVKERDGVPFFDLTAAKTEAGIRRVPVHPKLVELGFLDYVRRIRRGTLWPGLKTGGPDKLQSYVLSKAFTRWRRARGVDRPRVSFHSLRKNVVESLERARVHQSEVAQVVGHEKGFTFSVYSPHGLDLRGLLAVVERVDYPGLKLLA